MSHSERQISSSTASHKCGFRALKSSRTAEKRLQLTAFTTWRDRAGPVRGAGGCCVPPSPPPPSQAVRPPRPSIERGHRSPTMTRSKTARHRCARSAPGGGSEEAGSGEAARPERQNPSGGLWGTRSPRLSQQRARGLPRGRSANRANFPGQRGRTLPAPPAALTRAAVTDPDSHETDRRTLCREGQRARSVTPGRATPLSGTRQSSVRPAALRAQGQKHRAAELQSSAGRTRATGASLTLPSPKHPSRARAA